MSTAEIESSLERVPILCEGRLTECQAERNERVYNPSTGQAIAAVPLCSAEQTN